ncbi:hypothetical protein [Mobiluncus mulieris]|uniref:Uncharacterized protein n=1 Tax=Mobiluncus mulieris TaxID=2052 RepID=A0ABD4TZG1_9ACTO|nr:hypothetical protein [Mobiluncus mulieris]MCU9969617.1 hypothetical protein [Mobiluncus mulieris]MCU9974300.1 hypothetical protein [Mobiluncus mulieris]MCV0010409.1 hypothetical protein [Mobiluncus mulieris]NMX02213.1 hypothetical protein [Mobiluncus mulieris]NMX20710.1 hypothetical protein [Mobiluncus mulieris]
MTTRDGSQPNSQTKNRATLVALREQNHLHYTRRKNLHLTLVSGYFDFAEVQAGNLIHAWHGWSWRVCFRLESVPAAVFIAA